jgi:hypothetical protein
MTYLPQPNANYRSPRVQLADMTHAVLRLPDGHRSRGKLETVSLTGGLLSVSPMLDQGSRIKLMFLTHTGPVFGTAEMLSPVSTTRQPFRFISLEKGDARRLRAALRASLNQNQGQNPGQNPGQNLVEQAWIEKYRATLVHRNPRQRGVFRIVLEALTLLTFCLGTAIYLLHVHLPK